MTNLFITIKKYLCHSLNVVFVSFLVFFVPKFIWQYGANFDLIPLNVISFVNWEMEHLLLLSFPLSLGFWDYTSDLPDPPSSRDVVGVSNTLNIFWGNLRKIFRNFECLLRHVCELMKHLFDLVFIYLSQLSRKPLLWLLSCRKWKMSSVDVSPVFVGVSGDGAQIEAWSFDSYHPAVEAKLLQNLLNLLRDFMNPLMRWGVIFCTGIYEECLKRWRIERRRRLPRAFLPFVKQILGESLHPYVQCYIQVLFSEGLKPSGSAEY